MIVFFNGGVVYSGVGLVPEEAFHSHFSSPMINVWDLVLHVFCTEWHTCEKNNASYDRTCTFFFQVPDMSSI